MRTIFVAVPLLLLSATAAADCICTCMNGRNQAICSSAMEIRPICPPRICPLEPPSIPPIFAPRIPPIGTQVCQPELVWNPVYGRYMWQRICR